MFKLDLEKPEEPEIKVPAPLGHRKSKRENIYFCFIDYANAFDHVDHNKLWEIVQEMGIAKVISRKVEQSWSCHAP